jgi:hypothetical protein
MPEVLIGQYSGKGTKIPFPEIPMPKRCFFSAPRAMVPEPSPSPLPPPKVVEPFTPKVEDVEYKQPPTINDDSNSVKDMKSHVIEPVEW